MNEIESAIYMTHLESLAETDLKQSLKKMIDFYFSSHHLTHETSDSIALWVFEKGDQELVDYIKEKNKVVGERLVSIVENGILVRKNKKF